MRTRFATGLALLLLVAPIHGEELSLSDDLEVIGQVRGAASNPIENALVIAFSLSDELRLRVTSGRLGGFAFPPLPVGVYRVVAVKKGFLPAFVTVTPTRRNHRVVLEMEDRHEASEVRKADAWTLRRSLPRDVLREVEIVLGETPFDDGPAVNSAKFAGSMESLTGYSGMTAERELERTSLAFSSDVGQWGVDFRGRRQLIDQAGSFDGSTNAAEAADVALEVRSSPSNTYRVTSTRATWSPTPMTRANTGVEAHSIAWHGRGSGIQVRYESHQNLFRTSGLQAEDTLEVEGNTLVYSGSRSDLGVSVRLRQDTFGGDTYDHDVLERYADLATTGRVAVSETIGFEYGVVTRVGEETFQLMPQTSAELHMGEAMSIQFAGAYKFDATPESLQPGPGIAYLGQSPTIDTRYRYSVTISSELGEGAGISASARRAAADALTFLLFDDRFDEFWDGLYLRSGEVLTDGVLSIRAGIGPAFELAMIASAGRVDSPAEGFDGKRYVSGEIQTHYAPTGTTLDLSYRLLDQPDLADETLLREIERMSIVMGQSLHLPVDLRLLLGFSIGSEGEAVAERGRQTRLVGGLSFSF